MEFYRLLLDVDTVLDTRMGTLLGMAPGIGPTLIQNGYFTRDWDDIPTLTRGKVTQEAYDAAYAARNYETLQRSLITRIPAITASYIEQILAPNQSRGVDVGEIHITLNVAPYRLSGLVADMLLSALGFYLPPMARLHVKAMTDEQMALENLVACYDGWVTYDYDLWYQRNHRQLITGQARRFNVVLPKLHKGGPPRTDEESRRVLEGGDVYGYHAMVMEEFIHLEYLPVVDFCLLTPATVPQDSPSPARVGVSLDGVETKSS